MLFRFDFYIDVELPKGGTPEEIINLREKLKQYLEYDFVDFKEFKWLKKAIDSEGIISFQVLTKNEILERMRTKGKT